MSTSRPGLLYGLYSARLRRQLADAPVPQHVAMIIDGNRRWARERALETAAHGHRAGAEKMREFLGWCDALGIRVVTLYLLSADNLTGRSNDELEQLFEIIGGLATDLAAEGSWRIQHVGTTDGLPIELVDQLQEAQRVTADRTGLHINLAVGYGGRREI
ncbi:MAG: undecaprenyl diphosphate synthase family protein, partial [Pseudolysinimonas sp.]